MVPHIHTAGGITVVLHNRPYHAAKDDAIYEKVVELVNAGFNDDVVLEVFEEKAKALQALALSTNLKYDGGVILYKDEALHNYATEILIDLLDQGQETTPLINFLENLMQNPSKRVVDDLYTFLEHGKMPITNDGCFLAYKKVRGNYKDIYSGNFDNSVGKVHEMPRNKVDENPDQTCSYGFHVCSYEYLPHFGMGDGSRVMVCKVNPADVVAIPRDYNNTKMRVSRYEVTDEVTDYFKQQDNVLTRNSVSNGKRDYQVYCRETWDGERFEEDCCWTKEEAIKCAEALREEDPSLAEIWVEELSTGETVWYWDEDERF